MRDDWRERVVGLADMVMNRDRFLAEPGSLVDDEEILLALGLDGDAITVTALHGAWFDHLAALFSRESFVAHRHMTVPDFDAFVLGLEGGEGATGAHWSLDEEIESPCPEVEDVEIRMSAEIPAASVDWVTTFQQNFSHPWEREINVNGPVRLLAVTNLETGEAHDPQAASYPAFAP